MSRSVTMAPPPHTQPPQPARRAHRRPGKSRRFDLKYSPYLYIAPFFIVFGAFGLYPMVRTLWMSLFDWDLLDHVNPQPFVGLDNYVTLLGDDKFWNAAGNTVAIFLMSTVPQLLLALWLANLLNRQLRGRTLLRMAIIVPNVTSVAAVGVVFGYAIFARGYGVVDWLIGLVPGLPADFDWREGPWWAPWTAISVMVDWRWTGYNALIFLAGMQAIPRDLYESAAIDGAGPWRQFWKITLPMLRPTFLFVIVVSTIGGMQLFTEPFIFGNGSTLGGSTGHFQTLAMYMYEKGIETPSTAGYGSAVAWMLFLIIIIVSALNFLLVRKSVRSEK
jgi:cellobiose transport system permease protein